MTAAVPDDEMLISVSFAVRMSGPLLDAPADALQEQTVAFMEQLTGHVIGQHPYAELIGGVAVSVQMTRSA